MFQILKIETQWEKGRKLLESKEAEVPPARKARGSTGSAL
jgi:hypothetical protein